MDIFKNISSCCVIIGLILLVLLIIFGYPVGITIYLLSNDNIYNEYYNIDYNDFAYEKYNIMILMNWALWLVALTIFIKMIKDFVKNIMDMGIPELNYLIPNKVICCKIIVIIITAIIYFASIITSIILVNKYIEPYIELYNYSMYNIMMYIAIMVLLVNIISLIATILTFCVQLILMLRDIIC